MKEGANRPGAFGADTLEVGPAGELALVCPNPKAWKARQPKTLTSVEYPGTAVEWGGRIFEVLDAQPLAGGGVRYRLAPWAEAHTIRRLEQYDAASESARARERSDRGDHVRQRRLSILLAPLYGLLPGARQKEMESEFGAPALAMTISSALPLLIIGFLGTLDRLLGGLGASLDMPGWLSPPAPIALYLFAESALRLASAASAGEPMGSMPVVIAYEAWREARRPAEAETDTEIEAKTETETANGESEALAAPPLSDDDRDRLDRYQMLEPLLSLLSPGEQALLAQHFGFSPVRWGKITVAVLLAVGGTNALAAVLNLTAGRFGVVDAAWILIGGFLTYEQLQRWKRVKAGEPAGSVLGLLVRPLARTLLQAE